MLNLAMLERVARVAEAPVRPQPQARASAPVPRPARDVFARSAAAPQDPLLRNAMRGLEARLAAVQEAATGAQPPAEPAAQRRLAMRLTPIQADLERLGAIQAAVRGLAGRRALTPDEAARTAKLAQEAARSLDGAALPRLETRLRVMASGAPPHRDVLTGVEQLDGRLGRLGGLQRRLAQQAQVTTSARELSRLEAEHAHATAQVARLGAARAGLTILALKPGLSRPQLAEAARLAREWPQASSPEAESRLLKRLETLMASVG